MNTHLKIPTAVTPAENPADPSQRDCADAARGVITSFRIPELRDEIETAYDLLTALDKTGDGIGGDLGHGVSAVALAARAALDNARSMLKAMEGAR